MALSYLEVPLECAVGAPWSLLLAFWARSFSLARGWPVHCRVFSVQCHWPLPLDASTNKTLLNLGEGVQNRPPTHTHTVLSHWSTSE